MMKEYPSREYWTEFLELYKSLPALWKIKSDAYKNRELKNEAYEIMISKLREAFPSGNREQVTKKINTLRTGYRKELSKVKAAEAKGENYVPSLWYYTVIDFLRNQDSLSMDDFDSESDENPFQSIEEVSITPPPPKKIIKKNSTPNNVQPQRVTQVPEPRMKLEENSLNGNNESVIIVRCWQNEYSKLTPEQQMYAKKAIDDVLFEGRLGLLTRNSVMINAAPRTFAIIPTLQSLPIITGSRSMKDPPDSE